MIEFPWNDRWNYECWFYFDEGSFPAVSGSGQLKLRTYKGVGRDSSNRLVLHHQIYYDQNNWRSFSARTYEISKEEFVWFLDRAIMQGKAEKDRRDDYLSLLSSFEKRPFNIRCNMIVYLDERYALIQERQRVCFINQGKYYRLSYHPYEPCIYIDMGNSTPLVLHNSFDPYQVAESFALGKTVTSISGRIFNGLTFCQMLEVMIENYTDTDLGYIEGAIAVRKLKESGAIGEEKAIELKSLGIEKIDDRFSHSRSLSERVMYTEDGRVYLRIRTKE